jgi:hypothetical protein
MKFKQPHMKAQYDSRPAKLKEICEFFESLSMGFGIDPVVTRVTDRVEGESGVHPAGRAVDFRNEIRGEAVSAFLYSEAQVQEILSRINGRYRREDGKQVCIHHSFKGMPAHFHIQIPAAWA